MFESLQRLPDDPILGLSAAYATDANPKKIDLGVGVYKDERGTTPVMSAVKKAEAWLLEQEASKAYLPPAGAPAFLAAAQSQLLGADSAVTGRAATVQTPGGCGALRVAADCLIKARPGATLWFSSPTWANHGHLLGSAGLQLKEYPYYDSANHSVDFEAMIVTLEEVPSGDIVLLHGCCHNPTGADLSLDQWQRVADVAKDKGWLAFVDIAYQGLGDGLEADAAGTRLLAETLPELVIANSCSKNYGLYRERTGWVTVICQQPAQADAVRTQLCNIARGMYSMPPSHGAAIVATIHGSDELRAEWMAELEAMRKRMQTLRQLFSEKAASRQLSQDFSHIARQKGMFSFLGLTPTQVATLASDHGIYMVGSSRINVAGISPDNVGWLVDALEEVC